MVLKKRVFDDIKLKQKDWMLDHPIWKNIIDYGLTFFVSTLSALVFAFGFNAFMDPGANLKDDSGAPVLLAKLVAGGVSGVGQAIAVFLELCGVRSVAMGGSFDEHLFYSIVYFAINVPLFVLAWRGIGKRFAVFTIINVAEVSLFIKLLTVDRVAGINFLALFINDNGGLFARAVFAGVCTGLSSALAFKVDISSGGIDVIAYYIALRKGTMVGKYSVIMNSITVLLFSLFASALGNPVVGSGFIAAWDPEYTAETFGRIFYSALYMLIGMFLVDAINVRNKKMKVEIVTDRKDLGQVLISCVPHGATLVQGEGVFTGQPRYVITMVVSSYETRDVVKIVRKEDPRAFVQVVSLARVYGRFFMKPVK
ncbi:MAG: YitT family protein [Bacilli bacterium]|jgi:uncharacterized membrane-anchored protein YitT (DUF2179 family)|nr:YitT family protein [Bacilli bacterium]